MNLVSWIKTSLGFDPAWRKPFNRGWIASGKGDWDQAIAEYSESIRVNPHLAETFFNRALSYSWKNDWEHAIADCTEAIRLNPKHRKAFHWRGVVYRSQARYEAALANFSKAIEIRSNYARAYYDRGVTYRLMSDLPKAIIDFTKAIELDLNAFPERGHLHLQLGNYDLASNDFSEAIRRDPSAALYRNRGWLSCQQNDLEGAISHLGGAIRLEPEVASHYTTRAFYHHARGDYTEAIADDLRAINLDDKNANAHNGLAWIFSTCPEDSHRNGDKAVHHALKAVEFGESNQLAYIGTLAASYAEAGNFEEAVRWARKFLDSNPPPENVERARLRLSLFEQRKPYREEKGKLETVRANTDYPSTTTT